MSRFILRVIVWCFALFSGCAAAGSVGQVGAFNLSACPTNWSAYSAPGRFVVGVGTLGSDTYTLGGTGGEATHVLTVAESPAHSHGGNNEYFLNAGAFGSLWGTVGLSGLDGTVYITTSPVFSGGGGAHENRPPYVALLYCQRTAEDGSEYPSLPIADAVLILEAALVLLAFSWGIALVVRSLINQR